MNSTTENSAHKLGLEGAAALDTQAKARKQRGFTLIELMVVLAIIGILAALVVPNVLGRADDARITAARTDVGNLVQALKLYKLDNQRFPTAEQGLQALPEALRHKAHVIYQSSTPLPPANKTQAHLRAVMVGHLRDEKSPQVLWQAAQALQADDAIFIDHIGRALDSASAKQAQQTASQCPHYRWLNELPYAPTRRSIQRAHVLVHTSRIEGGAHVIMEAALSGTPVLAFDCAAAGEFISEKENGWLIHSDEPHTYIQRALDITTDKATLTQVREFSRTSVAHLGWDEIANQVETIFQRAIELG